MEGHFQSYGFYYITHTPRDNQHQDYLDAFTNGIFMYNVIIR